MRYIFAVLCGLGKLFKYYNILSSRTIVTTVTVTIHILHNSRKEKE